MTDAELRARAIEKVAGELNEAEAIRAAVEREVRIQRALEMLPGSPLTAYRILRGEE